MLESGASAGLQTIDSKFVNLFGKQIGKREVNAQAIFRQLHGCRLNGRAVAR